MNSNHNNKETFKLLNVSESESGSDIPDLSVNVPRRKIKVKRKYRPGNDHKHGSDRRTCSIIAMWKALGVLLLLSLLVAIAALLVNLYERNDQLTKRLQEIQSESRQFPEEFHDIHSRLKFLEANGTVFWGTVVKINNDIAALSKDVQLLKQTADSLSKSIAAAPQIETLPKDVISLQKDVASMGSKIKDLEIALKESKDESSSTNQANNVEALQEFRKIIDNLNQSLSSQIQEAADRTRVFNADIVALKNDTLLLDAQTQALKNKSLFYEQMSEHLQALVLEMMNQSTHQTTSMSSANATINSSATVLQLSSHVKNLTKLYHALLQRMIQFETGFQKDLNYNLLNTNFTVGLESMMAVALESSEARLLEQFKNDTVRLYIIEQQLHLLMSQLNSERNATSQLAYFNFTGTNQQLDGNGKMLVPLHPLTSVDPPPEKYLWHPNTTTANRSAPVRNNNSSSPNGKR